jgi:type II secretory pathway component PulF
MNEFLDYLLTVTLICVLIILYIVVPFFTGYYLYRRTWLNDRLRTFLSASLMISAAGVAVLVVIKSFG